MQLCLKERWAALFDCRATASEAVDLNGCFAQESCCFCFQWPVHSRSFSIDDLSVFNNGAQGTYFQTSHLSGWAKFPF